MKAILAVVPAILVAACTSTGGGSSLMASSSSSTRYWTGVSDSVDAFRHDNVVCSARASKFGNITSGAPENRIDRPMQKWPNDVAQETYEQCMHDVGWRSTAS